MLEKFISFLLGRPAWLRSLIKKRGVVGHLWHALWNAGPNLLDWLQGRWKKMDLFDESFTEEAKTNPWYALGGMWYWVWILVLVSGFVLMIYYVPVTDQAFKSIERIQYNWKWGSIPIGAIVRGIHKYGADSFIILATLRVYRIWFTGSYKQGGWMRI